LKTGFSSLIYLLIAIGFTGCSLSGDYDLGLYTKTVKGTINFSSEINTKEAFILVLNHHRTLMETSEGYLSRVTASLEHPNEKGEYSASFDADTVELELIIYAENCLVESGRFHRTLGIGHYIHNKALQKDKNWRNSYFVMIKPILIEYINENRYLMSQQDKYYLGEWLSKSEDNLP